MEKNDDIKVVATNRKAWHDYHIINKYEAGIVLLGTEVKSVRQGTVNLKDSYATFKNGEIFLIGVHIGPYKQAGVCNHNPERVRKLLLNRREINKLIGTLKEKGVSLVPLLVYIKNAKIKVEIAIVKGKRQYDKREAIQKRDMDREARREMKNRQY
ncbi:MAG: SsrA-binding protein SmpB [bacterium]|nr:SsrA-binding protein SmpB [bacterium]